MEWQLRMLIVSPWAKQIKMYVSRNLFMKTDCLAATWPLGWKCHLNHARAFWHKTWTCGGLLQNCSLFADWQEKTQLGQYLFQGLQEELEGHAQFSIWIVISLDLHWHWRLADPLTSQYQNSHRLDLKLKPQELWKWTRST